MAEIGDVIPKCATHFWRVVSTRRTFHSDSPFLEKILSKSGALSETVD